MSTGDRPWCSSRLARLRCTASLSVCAMRAGVPGNGQCLGKLGGLTVGWGPRAFVLLSHLHPLCAKLSSGTAFGRSWSWPLCAGERRPTEQESGPEDKSITQQSEKGKDLPGLQVSSHPWHKPRHPRMEQKEVHSAKAAPNCPCNGRAGRGVQSPQEGS